MKKLLLILLCLAAFIAVTCACLAQQTTLLFDSVTGALTRPTAAIFKSANGISSGGSVTSVALSLPAIFTVSGSPVTTTGTLTGTLATQSANLVLAGPSSGSAAQPTFRLLVAADLPATAVTPRAYTSANITVDQQGRITAAADGSSGSGSPGGSDGDWQYNNSGSFGGKTPATGWNTVFATPSSVNLKAWLTDETGSGAAVFATSPTLVTPLLGTPTSGNLANCTFPTLNQNTTGTASAWTTGRTIAITGDLTYTSPSLDGTGNVTAAGTLATVNSNVGTFGSATKASIVTVNGKGLVTAASESTVTPAVGSITGLGTGVGTALAVNVGTAGAPVVNGGALGTPSSGTLTNATGLPQAGTVGLTTADSPQFTGVNVGNATDTTVTRVSAGIIAVEGATIATTASGTAASIPHSVSLSIDGSGSVLTAGSSIPVKTYFGGTLVGYTMMVSPSGSLTFNILRAANNAGLPTASIINNVGGGSGSGTLPAISSGVEGSGSTFTSWGSTTVTALDNFCIAITSPTTATKCTFILWFR